MWLSINVHRCLPNYYRFYWSEFKAWIATANPLKQLWVWRDPLLTAHDDYYLWQGFRSEKVWFVQSSKMENIEKNMQTYFCKSLEKHLMLMFMLFLSRVTQTQQMSASLLINIRKRLITFTFHLRMSRANYRVLTQMPQPCCTSCKSLLNIITSFPRASAAFWLRIVRACKVFWHFRKSRD